MEIPIRVLKFGGTSMGTTPERLTRTAEIVAEVRRQGHPTVVVVSARGDSTDLLVEEAYTATSAPPPRELDQLLATGEAQSAALLAMALHGMGLPARSMLGGQAGIQVRGAHTDGRISAIDATLVRAALALGEVVVVAGFQGVNAAGDVITLGRGGSDTSAVALAIELGAAACEIYTDVDGIYNADPRLVPDARHIPTVRNSVMAEMAYAGARVLHTRSVELAGRAGADIHVRSAFNQSPGTVVASDPKGCDMLESDDRVIAVAHDAETARITVDSLAADGNPFGAEGFAKLAEAGVTVDVVTRFADGEGRCGWDFTVARKDVAAATEVLAASSGAITVDSRVAKVSIVGAGLMSDPRCAGRMLSALLDAGVEPLSIATSQARISATVPDTDCTRSVVALHREFRLGAQAGPGAGASAVADDRPAVLAPVS
ncbi:aspartate kinase [Kitasatospora sp. NPDC096147]|uniref:aspartate kinase n=1 Tax=Kitasatospora sp. NPDC096147 TaxID=3364093 RepID=UPI003802AB3D